MVVELINQTLSRFPRFAQQQIVVRPLEKGGSDRNFYRISVGEQASLILAKYGQQREENRHYVDIARFLAGIGVRVPHIYFHDESEGLIWMEDLGESDLWSYRHDSWEVRQLFYRDAIEQIVALHSRAHIAYNGEAPKLQAGFDTQLYLWEQNYFAENCLHRSFHLETTALDDRLGIRARLQEIAEQLAALPRCFVHRDFQSQNIVIKEGRAYFIDFQGMRQGLPHYDLASLLYDPYVALTSLERHALLQHYLAGCEDVGTEAPPNFSEVLDLCAMQRLMQALGAYGFLGLVKGRTHFLEHIPAALTNLCEVTGRIPGLDGLGRLLADLPPPGQARDASRIP